MKTFLKRLALCLGGLALLLILFHAVENWRGRRAWAQWKQARIAAGDSFDLARLMPPEVSDADNFGAAPLIAAAVSGKSKDKFPVAPSALAESKALGSWREAQRADLDALKAKLKITDWQEILGPVEGELAELTEASQRPSCRLLKTYDLAGGEFPQLLGMRHRARLLSLRALVALHEKRDLAALADIHTGLRVAAHLQKEPHLISQLLRLAWVNILLQPIWEGLQDQRWNEAQLAELQTSLAGIDLVDSYRRGWQAERLGMLASFEKVAAASPWARPNIFNTNGRWGTLLGRLFLPTGWLHQNMLRMDRFNVAQFNDVLDPARHRIGARASQSTSDAFSRIRRSPYTFIFQLTAPALSAQNLRLARSQSGLDLAVITCALERYRLAKGRYPASLEALAPAYLPKAPVDVLEGQPLKYASADGKTFRLYSLGWNLTDEGGQLVPRGQDGNLILEQGDWIWSR